MVRRKVGKVLKGFRGAKGLTQVELAEKAQLTQSYLAMLESGERVNPSLDILQRLAKALKVDIGELLDGT